MSDGSIEDLSYTLLYCKESFQDFEVPIVQSYWVPLITEYIDLLESKEQVYFPDCNAFTRQKDVTLQMRTILIDWLMDLSTKFFLKRETVYLSISHIDRLISLKNINRSDLQLLSLICLHLACKSNEVKIPKLNALFKSSHLSLPSVPLQKLETQILKTLSWKIYPLTSIEFLNVLLVEWDIFISISFNQYIFYISNLQHDKIKQQDLLNKRLITFKQENTYSYKRFREIVQVLDACILEFGFYKQKTWKMVASLLYVIGNRCFFNTSYELFWWNSLVLNSEYQNQSEILGVEMVHKLMESFLCKIFKIFSLDPLTESLNYLSRFIEFEYSYNLPSICKVQSNIQESYENFLSYQTHSLSNKLFILRNPYKSGQEEHNYYNDQIVVTI
jgi:hypothetical protein